MDGNRYDQLKAELREYYDRDAERRSNLSLSAWKQKARREFLELLLAEKKHTLLEVGAGSGNDGVYFQSNGLEVTCTDLSPAMVAACRKRGLKAEVKDFLSLDYDDASFDAIYAMNCLLHVPNNDMPAVLTTLRRLLAPGGLFYLGTYGGRAEETYFGRGPTEGNRFFAFRTDEQLKKIVSDYFELVEFEVIAEQANDNEYTRFQKSFWRRPN
jgi:SAM-dependent methyltransferase